MAESSLAADLLADFNDSDDEGDFRDDDDQSAGLANGERGGGDGDGDDAMDVDGGALEQETAKQGDVNTTGTPDPRANANGTELSVDDDEEQRKEKVEKMSLGAVDDVRSVAGLMKQLGPVLKEISRYQSSPPKKLIGNVEDNPEYKLLVEANAHAVSIDNEIILVHKFIRDHYTVRFPELEKLVINPLDYAKVINILGNDVDDIKDLERRNGHKLRQVLDGPTMMTVTVEASQSNGRALSDRELQIVKSAADMILQLDAAKRTITIYVESRMSIFAPNISAIIGSQTAAQLINFAGGLKGLAATPACNIPALGSKRNTGTIGLASNIGIRRQGHLYHSPIIREVPNEYKNQAMRISAAKVILAARMDLSHGYPNGSYGEEVKENILEKLEKLTIPPPNKGPRALPAPDDKPSRKRGGRRARKAKEATAMTDLRKAQNRMSFGKQEEETSYGISDSTKGLGMIGQQQNGRIRALQVDQRTRAKLGKSNPGWAGISAPAGGAQSMLRSSGTGSLAPGLAALGSRSMLGVGGETAGTASSLAFTPFQGIELIDPKVAEERKRKRAVEDDKWFSGGTFTQVGTGSMGPPPLKKADTGQGKGLMGPPPRK